MSESSHWWQVSYGKITPCGKDDAVVTGSEHRCTGRSAELPADIARQCFPHKVGIGTSDQFKWKDHPWKRGGLILRPVFHGQWHLLAGRIRGRSEEGENIPGRLYTQARYLIAPISSIESFIELSFSELIADTEVKIDVDLPRVEVGTDATASQPLEETWLHTTSPILEALLCGESFSLQDRDIEPDEFLHTAMTCLACLPADVRWRIPVGCGMFMIEGVGIGHGLRAVGGVRKVNGEIRGNEALDSDARRKAQDYIDWLDTITQNESQLTRVQLAQIVDQQFQSMNRVSFESRESIEARESQSAKGKQDAASLHSTYWVESVTLMLGHMIDHARLGKFKKVLESSDQTQRFEVESLVACRELLIQEITKHLGQENANGIPYLLKVQSWKTAWVKASEVCQHSAAIAVLLGYVEFDVSKINAALDTHLPKQWNDNIVSLLRGALERESTSDKRLAKWLALVSATDKQSKTAWVGAFRESLLYELHWTKLRLLLIAPSHQGTRATREKWVEFGRLAADESPEPNYSKLVAELALQDDQPLRVCARALLERLILHCVSRRRFVSAVILHDLALRLGTRKGELIPVGKAPEAVETRAQYLNAIAASFPKLGEAIPKEMSRALCRCLLTDWRLIDGKLREKLLLTVTQGIPPHWAGILVGHALDGSTQRAENKGLAYSALQLAIRNSDEVLDRAVLSIAETDDSEIKQLVLQLGSSEQLPASTLLGYLQRVSRGQWPEFPEASLLGATALLKLGNSVGMPIPEDVPVRSIAQLRVALAVGDSTSVRRLGLSPVLYAQAVEEAATEEGGMFWQLVLDQRQLKEVDIWRLVLPGRLASKPSLTPDEVSVVAQCEPRIILDSIIPNFEFSVEGFAAVAERIDYPLLKFVKFAIADLPHLVDMIVESNAEALGRATLLYCVQLASKKTTTPTMASALESGKKKKGLIKSQKNHWTDAVADGEMRTLLGLFHRLARFCPSENSPLENIERLVKYLNAGQQRQH